MTVFGLERYILWMIVVDSSFQYQGPDGIYSTTENISPTRNVCACPDKDGKLYNLEPLGFKNETPSFTAKGTTYKGYSYSYNPCHPFKKGPETSGCQLKARVAICKWVPNTKESPHNYIPIGHQDGFKCGYDEKTKTPTVEYQICSPSEYRKSTVRLKCAEGNSDQTSFQITDEDNWIFELTHFWDVCPSHSNLAITIAAAAVSGVVAATGLLWLVRHYCKKPNQNNDIGERRRLLDNGGGDQHADVIHNPIEELNPENRSRPTPIGSSRTKADVNVIRSALNFF